MANWALEILAGGEQIPTRPFLCHDESGYTDYDGLVYRKVKNGKWVGGVYLLGSSQVNVQFTLGIGDPHDNQYYGGNSNGILQTSADVDRMKDWLERDFGKRVRHVGNIIAVSPPAGTWTYEAHVVDVQYFYDFDGQVAQYQISNPPKRFWNDQKGLSMFSPIPFFMHQREKEFDMNDFYNMYHSGIWNLIVESGSSVAAGTATYYAEAKQVILFGEYSLDEYYKDFFRSF